ncbi:hypothetical protein EXIGLDRAFT_769597 [Exidia glandulosa HHB12029]|uniref:Uncharacterized protein n=1 Tax=Exidia glandulosa HHB12029 TaxID=1314781 RepID=A0A165HBW8_EXIGL|nr:hypothetical protein EXIGLDRAFT_769597 [Exidia glandulosa HHB12029]
MTSTCTDPARLYSTLNRRYARALDGRTIRYGSQHHVWLSYDSCSRKAAAHIRFLATRHLAYGLRNTKESMTFRLISYQLSEVLRLWRDIINRGSYFGVDRKVGGGGYLVHRLDVDMCEALDTVVSLEDSAQEMGIPGYTRVLVPTFTTEPCKCRCCMPDPTDLVWFWKCAQKYHSNLPSAVFERIFGAIRNEAAGL